MNRTLRPAAAAGSELRWLALVLAAAALLRAVDIYLVHVEYRRLSPDEGYSLWLAEMGWAEMLRQTAADTHPPLYYALLKAWFVITPSTMSSAKALSVLFALGTMWVVFRMGREMFSPAAGWVALALMAFAPYQIYWSHAARNHQLLALAAALVVWTTWRWLERGDRRRWWALACALALMINTNYMGLVALVIWAGALGMAEPLAAGRRMRLLAAAVPGLAAYLPWVPVMIAQRDGPMSISFFQETVFPFWLFFNSVFGLMVPYQPPQPWWLLPLTALAFTLVFVAGFRAVGRRWSFWTLLLGWPLAPIVVAYLADFTLAQRHLYFALPLFSVYYGAAAVEAWEILRRRAAERRSRPRPAPAPRLE